VSDKAVARRPVSIIVVDEGEERYVEATYADGETVRTRVDPKKKATRRPRIPQKRTRITDYTRNKRF
jgi:hypothetical protein